MPAANGRFAQVSGLCFTYDIHAAVGSRVTGAVRQAADGSCTGAAVGFGIGDTYTIAINDFMANGGDGYPVLISRATTRDIMDQRAVRAVTRNDVHSMISSGQSTGTGIKTETAPAFFSPMTFQAGRLEQRKDVAREINRAGPGRRKSGGIHLGPRRHHARYQSRKHPARGK